MAWKKGGHKHVCLTLKRKCSNYKIDRSRIDMAISSNRIVDGIVSVNGQNQECYLKPVAIYDYTIASMYVLMKHKEFENVEGPTIDIFTTT